MSLLLLAQMQKGDQLSMETSTSLLEKTVLTVTPLSLLISQLRCLSTMENLKEVIEETYSTLTSNQQVQRQKSTSFISLLLFSIFQEASLLQGQARQLKNNLKGRLSSFRKKKAKLKKIKSKVRPKFQEILYLKENLSLIIIFSQVEKPQEKLKLTQNQQQLRQEQKQEVNLSFKVLKSPSLKFQLKVSKLKKNSLKVT